MNLTSCSTCQSLVDASACRCPHCDATLRVCRPSRAAAAVLLGLSLAACAAPQPSYGIAVSNDTDADGFDRGVDCDDTDANVNPGAAEVPGNGVDDDCDGQIDEGEA